MGHEESDTEPQTHHDATDPDYPDTGVLGYLKPGVHPGVRAGKGEDQTIPTQLVKRRLLLVNLKELRFARSSHLQGGCQPLTRFIGQINDADAASVSQPGLGTRTECDLLHLAVFTVTDGKEEGGRVIGLSIAGLVKGNSFIGQRLVHDQAGMLVARHLTTVLRKGNDALELFRHLARPATARGIVERHRKLITTHLESQRDGLAVTGLDGVYRLSLHNRHEPFITEQAADDGSDKDHHNTEMHHVDPQPAPGGFLGKQVVVVINLCDDRCCKLFGKQVYQALLVLLKRSSQFQVAGREDFLLGLRENGGRRTDEGENMGQSLDGTSDQIDREQGQQGQEPPGVVHVKKAQLFVKCLFGGADGAPVALVNVRELRDDRSDDRGDRQGDQQGNRQLERAEKIPDSLHKATFIGAQDGHSEGGLRQTHNTRPFMSCITI